MTQHPRSCQNKQGTIPIALHTHNPGDLFSPCLYTFDILPSFGAWWSLVLLNQPEPQASSSDQTFVGRSLRLPPKTTQSGGIPRLKGKWEKEIVSVWWWQVRLRLTEQESGPAFPRCDGKYNNTALCQTPKPGYPTPTGQHVLLFPVSIPIWWVSWPHDESCPLWLPYMHPENAKGIYSECWVTSTFPPFRTCPLSLLPVSAVNHPGPGLKVRPDCCCL